MRRHSPSVKPGRLLATALCALSAAAPAAAAELQAYAGAVGGIAQGTGSVFACGTSGPTIGNGWAAGLVLPTEGLAGCKLAGSIENKTAPAGPLAAFADVAAPVTGGSFTGAASAVANYGRLGVAASGTMTGGTTPYTFHQTSGFARFQDTLTLSNAGVATGTAGTVDFAFLIDGLLRSVPNAPYSQQGDLALGIRVGDSVGSGRGPWYSFRATVVNDGLPFVRGGGSGMPGDFVLSPGSLQGSAEVLSTAGFGVSWGVPFEVEVALLTSVWPCCYGSSVDSQFLSSALLTGISARANGTPVADFSVLSASGTAYGPGGLLPVPEPASLLLWAVGLLLTLRQVRASRR